MIFDVPDFKRCGQRDIDNFIADMHKIAGNEHAENREMAKNNETAAPSVAFNKAGQTARAALKAHTDFIKDKMNGGEEYVTIRDLQNAMNLERLSVITSTDPNGDRGRHFLANLEKGKPTNAAVSGSSHAQWKLIQISARRANVLATEVKPEMPRSGGPNMEVRI